MLFHAPRVFLELHHRDSMIARAGARGHAAREGRVLFQRTERGPQGVFQFLGLIRHQAFGRERMAHMAAEPQQIALTIAVLISTPFARHGVGAPLGMVGFRAHRRHHCAREGGQTVSGV